MTETSETDNIVNESESENDISTIQTSANGSKSKDTSPPSLTKLLKNEAKVPTSLSDAALYSYASVFAVSLVRLYEDTLHREYKEASLKAILEHLQQPKQVCDSMMAILNGVDVDTIDPFVEVLLRDPVLDGSGLPIIADLLKFTLRSGEYDARTRVLIKRFAWYLRVNWDMVEELESVIAQSLNTLQAYKATEEEEKEMAKRARKQKAKRIALIGLATIGGGALIGLTGGLAAPLVAAGASAVIGGAGAALLGSTAGVAVIGSLFGVAGAGLTGYKMKRRVGAVEEFEFIPLHHGNQLGQTDETRHLHITIAVTGWLSKSMMDFRQPWKNLADSPEQYCLRWESKYLLNLGSAFDYILNSAMSFATQEALKYTILSGLIAAILWPATLVSAANVIDNPWSVCAQRARATGKQLADVLLARQHGKRPVTLIGYSLGARVIFSCLEELTKRIGSEDLVEDVILLGAPVSADVKHWQPLAKVVAGKIINGYSRGDWLLKFLHRTASVQMSIAGLRAVRWDDRRMCNMDLSDLVGGHMDYMKNLDEILSVIGVRQRREIRYTGLLSPDELSPATDCSDLTNTDVEVAVEAMDDTTSANVCMSDICMLDDCTADSRIPETKSETPVSDAEGLICLSGTPSNVS